MSLAAFESVATATAMPVVARALDALDGYTWAFTAFVVASLLGMVTAGVWSDAGGPRMPTVVGVAGFTIGSVISGAANTLGVLIVGRAVQGVGSGAIVVAVYVIIARTYPDALRPKAFSALAAAWVLPALVGPPIAGWLADSVTWRAVFWLVPLLVVWPLVVIVRHIPADERTPIAANGWARIRMGALTAVGLFAIQDGALREGPLAVPEVLLGLGCVVLGTRALLPPGALAFGRGLPTTVMMRGLLASAFFSAEVFVPLALVQLRGATTTQAGMALAGAALTWAAGSAIQGRVHAEADRSRLVQIGAVLVTIAILIVPVALMEEMPVLLVPVAWAIGAFGMGLSIPSVSVQAMRLTSAQTQGMTSAGLQLIDATCVVVAAAAVGVVYSLAERADLVSWTTFAVIYVISASIGVLAAGLAPRMKPVPSR